MADPTGGIGKASEQMIEELQKQTQRTEQQGPQKLQFDDVLSQKGVQDPTRVSEVTQLQDPTRVADAVKAQDVLRIAQVNATDPSRLGVKPVEGATKAETPGLGAGLKSLLNQVVDGQNKLDDIIRLASSGKSYSNQQLLAIQAAVYKFSQELDLTGKTVEKATSGVKQTMQTQV